MTCLTAADKLVNLKYNGNDQAAGQMILFLANSFFYSQCEPESAHHPDEHCYLEKQIYSSYLCSGQHRDHSREQPHLGGQRSCGRSTANLSINGMLSGRVYFELPYAAYIVTVKMLEVSFNSQSGNYLESKRILRQGSTLQKGISPQA